MSERSKRPSTAGPRAQAACMRACSSYQRVAALAKQVNEDLDEITIPGVPVEIHEEDSIVTSTEAVIEHQIAISRTITGNVAKG